ncbi:MAG: glycosyltransferase [bacterium]|nr:glycosyltransferase [bacterium]
MNAPLRVCLIALDAYSLFNPLARTPYGDPEIIAFELARRLGSDERIDVSAIVGDAGQEEVEYSAGVLLYRAASNQRTGWLKRLVFRQTEFEKQLALIDAQVYVMTGASPLAKTAAEFCRKKKRAFVYLAFHSRDCDGTYIHANGDDGQRFRDGLRAAQSVVCNTGEQARMLLRTEGIKALVLPPIVSPSPPAPTHESEVVWAGELLEWKQPEYFMRLAATLPNITFTLYGQPRKPEYLEKLVEKTRNLPNLAFQNSVPFADLGAFISRAKLFVNTSRFDGYPHAMAMAMQSGLAVATLNIELDGDIERHAMGFCARGSEVTLAQETLAVIEFPRQWKRFSDNALKYAQDRLDHKTVYKQYLRVIMIAARDAAETKGKKKKKTMKE